jgi:hypothetical protein
MATPEGLCTACSATGYCQEHICLEGHPTMSEPMDLATAHRCIDSCAKYLAERDESPRAAKDLRKAVSVVTTALRQQVEALTRERDDLQCPHGDKSCACAVTTRHEAFDWFCAERQKRQKAEAALATLQREHANLVHANILAESKLHYAVAQRDQLLTALRELVELGRKDLSNPKYDSYYDAARAVLTGGE